jgi:small subunit ribosomal protein S16
MGAKKRPFFRLVASDSRSPRDGRFIEVIGQYHPISKPPRLEIQEKRLYYWLKNGSEPTQTVQALLKQTGAWAKWLKISKGETPSEAEVNKEIHQTSRKKAKKKETKPEQAAGAKA